MESNLTNKYRIKKIACKEETKNEIKVDNNCAMYCFSELY